MRQMVADVNMIPKVELIAEVYLPVVVTRVEAS